MFALLINKIETAVIKKKRKKELNVLNGKKIELGALSEGLFAELIFEKENHLIENLVFGGPG